MKCHGSENQLPRAVQIAFSLAQLLQSGSVTPNFYHILTGGILIASKCSGLWLLYIPLGTGPFAKEAVGVVAWTGDLVHLGSIHGSTCELIDLGGTI